MRERDRLKQLKEDPIAETAREKKDDNKRESGPTRRRTALELKLDQAGLNISARFYLTASIAIGLTVAIISSRLGLLLSIFMLSAFLNYLLVGYLEEKALKRQRKVVPQLAPFIDSLASALSTGFNLEGAFVQATQGVPSGLLRSELDRVVGSLSQGFSVKEATSSLHHRIAGKEMTSMVVALGLFSTMGGSVLDPFRRLARKIREQQTVTERANRDLVLVKQAFHIILFLALAAPAIILFVQPNYLHTALDDSLGRILIQIGAIMIIGSLFLFKKLTNVKM